MRPHRPFLKIQIPATEEELWALGVVVYVWTALENDLDLWVYMAHGQKVPTGEGGKHLGFRARVKLLKRMVQEKVTPPIRERFLDTIDGVLEAQDKRDRLLHWMWAEGEEGQLSAADWKQPKPTKDGYPRREIKISMGQLMELAQRIDRNRASLAEIMFQNGAVKEGYLLSTAWKNITAA
jgi:hypothetical protein